MTGRCHSIWRPRSVLPIALPFEKDKPMPHTKTLQQRELELRSLLGSPAGRKELQELESSYRAESGKLKPANTSVITYILVHERERGLISG
jgi:hypothetical protein